MKKKKRVALFPYHTDKYLIISMFFLFLFGTLMIISTEMGLNAGDTSVVLSTLISQFIYFGIGLVGIVFLTRFRLINRKMQFIWTIYIFILVLLLIALFFAPTNGARAWIWIGGKTIQPSEFAKVFIIVLGAKLLGEKNIKDIKKNMWTFVIATLIYTFVIVVLQKDLGSGVVLFGIAYIILLISPQRDLFKIHLIMWGVVIAGMFIALFIFSKAGTAFLNHFSDNYMAGRFLAAANPFAYQYDSGYHLIMGLVSFATGGMFGVGLGNSIHKYMNFPNSPSDFILPIIVEELGIVFGLLPIVIGYGIIIWRLIKHSLETESVASKMVYVGTFAYLTIHIILNIGGVTGLIPLTGVPLLLISRGGSSLISFMAAIGLCEKEIIHNKKREKHESNSGQI